MVVWADFEHDDTMEVLSKECHALSDDEQDSVVEEEVDSVESFEDADDDDVETDFVPGHVRIVKEEEEEEEDEGEEVHGGDDNVDYPQHDNVDHENDLPLGGEDWEYPELYRDHTEEDSNEHEEGELEEETPSVPTDEHTIRKKVLPAEQARLGLVNRAMNKLLSDESMSINNRAEFFSKI